MILGPRFDRALALAHDLHRDQTRKGGNIPYISHLLAVCGLVLEDGGTEDEAIAALLHDAVEDQGGQETLDRIRDLFGDHVAGIVLECTDKIERRPADDSPKGWRRRKEADLAKIASLSQGALRVKTADRLHNLRSLITDYHIDGEMLWRRFNGGRAGTLWFNRASAEALMTTRPDNILCQELIRACNSLENLLKFDLETDSSQ
ncbi:HD domain-containing protein [Aestuariispira insulae]|uniref:HD domain-containing protein n=1 Tax=Aestuariispira insulae TaxID=1461337 RepID=A0A3D9HP49_9PROT|nr:HD domain-containing protein [Aestuariispira insulae]RED51274.1 HD domain-containing protein [Aestuariispira insulae]